jgi:hypothetical protein
LCVWLLAGLAFCAGGVMYCIASINETNPRHDRSTSGFLHTVGFFCSAASLFLAANALYVTAWQLPFHGWGPDVVWRDWNNRYVTDPIVGLAFSADGSVLLARHEKGGCQAWDWHGDELDPRLASAAPPVADPVRDGRHSAPDGRRLVITGADGQISITVGNAGTEEPLHTYKLAGSAITTCAAFSTDGKHALVALDQSVCLLRLP